MGLNEKGWHAVKKLSALIWGITSKHNGDSYCLNCLHCFRTENKLKCYKKVCKNKDFCEIALQTQKDNILKHNQLMKSDKTPFIIYADLESFIKKIDNCKNNSEKSSTTKIGEHIPRGYSISTIWAFDDTESKYSLYLGEDMKKVISCIKKVCKKVLYFFKKTCSKCNWF